MSTNHYRRAEDLLEKAAGVEGTPRHHYARAYAAMAQAHATLALVKATRQATGAPAEPDDMPDDLVERVIDRLTAAEPECGVPFGDGYACSLPAGHGHDDQPTCTCRTGARGDHCPEHDSPLFEIGARS